MAVYLRLCITTVCHIEKFPYYDIHLSYERSVCMITICHTNSTFFVWRMYFKLRKQWSLMIERSLIRMKQSFLLVDVASGVHLSQISASQCCCAMISQNYQLSMWQKYSMNCLYPVHHTIITCGMYGRTIITWHILARFTAHAVFGLRWGLRFMELSLQLTVKTSQSAFLILMWLLNWSSLF